MDGFEGPISNLLASGNQSGWIEGRTWLQVPVTLISTNTNTPTITGIDLTR